MQTLDGKVVAITGAGSGIGRALALHAASVGAKVALSDVNEANVKETARMVGEQRGTASATKVDVADRAAVFAWADQVKAEHGPADVIVNNAGVSLSETIESMKDEDFKWLFDINFWGVVYGTKAFLPQLYTRPEAHVVNVSSVFGIISVPTQAAYNAAKFAVRGYTEALRQELKKTQVRVTCVHPGGIKTNIVRNGRQYTDVQGQHVDAEVAGAEFERIARTTPADAARAITGAILKERPRLLIGADAHLIDLVARLFPAGYDRVVSAVTRAQRRKPS